MASLSSGDEVPRRRACCADRERGVSRPNSRTPTRPLISLCSAPCAAQAGQPKFMRLWPASGLANACPNDLARALMLPAWYSTAILSLRTRARRRLSMS